MVIFHLQAVLNIFYAYAIFEDAGSHISFLGQPFGLLFPILDLPPSYSMSLLSWLISDSLKGCYEGGSGEASRRESSSN